MYKVLYRSQGKWKDLSVPQDTLEKCYEIIRESEEYDLNFSKHGPKYAIQDINTGIVFDKYGTHVAKQEVTASFEDAAI